VSPGKPFTGFMVNVESHVGQKSVPDERTFEKWVRAALQGRRSKRPVAASIHKFLRRLNCRSLA